MLKSTQRRLGVAGAAFAAAACLTLVSVVPANADPVTPGTFYELAGTGSDTTQDVMNALAVAVNTAHSPSLSGFSGLLASYDAVDPTTGVAGGTITPKSGVTFNRPNGSGAGRKALSAAQQSGTIGGVAVTPTTLAYSRSSVTGTSNDTSHALLYVPFAQDVLTYAVNAGSDFPRDIPLGSSTGDTSALTLYNIYHCTFTSFVDGNGNAITITPKLPQSGSGTRQAWENLVGITDGNLTDGTAPCVKDTETNNTSVPIQEHDGTTLVSAGDIAPFSAAQYISQGNHKALSAATPGGAPILERRGNIALGRVSGKNPVTDTVGTVGSKPNSAFPLKRLVFNVIPNDTSSLPAGEVTDLNATFVGNGSYICQLGSTIQSYGFLTLSTSTGAIGSCGVPFDSQVFDGPTQ